MRREKHDCIACQWRKKQKTRGKLNEYVKGAGEEDERTKKLPLKEE